MPLFEFDPAKSQANLAKHGIDFEAAQQLWSDENAIENQTSYQDEDRYYRIGQIGQKLWTAFFTYREGRVRIISVRRAREKERHSYDSRGS
jgi:uncharacterized protein